MLPLHNRFGKPDEQHVERPPFFTAPSNYLTPQTMTAHQEEYTRHIPITAEFGEPNHLPFFIGPPITHPYDTHRFPINPQQPVPFPVIRPNDCAEPNPMNDFMQPRFYPNPPVFPPPIPPPYRPPCPFPYPDLPIRPPPMQPPVVVPFEDNWVIPPWSFSPPISTQSPSPPSSPTSLFPHLLEPGEQRRRLYERLERMNITSVGNSLFSRSSNTLGNRESEAVGCFRKKEWYRVFYEGDGKS